MGYVDRKIRIGNGITLTIRHVVVTDFRSRLLTQAPGFDLAAPTRSGGPSGTLKHNETAVTYSVCLPTSMWLGGFSSSPRAASRPGNHSFQLDLPQAGCVNVTPSTATPLLYPPVRGLALQPRLPARCWASRGVFLDVAVPGADVAPAGAGRATVPNNYDVILLNVSYMCASVMTPACVVEYKDPLVCAMATLQSDSARLAWRLPEGSEAEMVVRSGRELAAVLAAAPLVTSVVIERNVWMHQDDWEGLLGGLDGTEPAVLSRDVTIAGSPQLASWPLLNLGFVRGKIRVASGVKLTTRRVLVGDWRIEGAAKGLGFDLAAATLLNAYDTTTGVLVQNETALLYDFCLPVATWEDSLSTARAAPHPRVQSYELDLPQPGCVNVTASSSSSSSIVTSYGPLQPPLLSRCWASRGAFLDVAVSVANVSLEGQSVGIAYDVVLYNVSYVCADVMSSTCLRDHAGPVACLLWLMEDRKRPVPVWRESLPAEEPPPPARPVLIRAGGGNGGRDTEAAAIGGAVGGTVLLALLAAAAFLLVRRRRQQAKDGGPPLPSFLDKQRLPATAAADGVVGGPGGGALDPWKSGTGGQPVHSVTAALFNASVPAAAVATAAKSAPTRAATGTASESVPGGEVDAAGGGGGEGSPSPSASASGAEENTPGISSEPGAVAAEGGLSGQQDSEGQMGLATSTGGGAVAPPSYSDRTGDPLTCSGVASSGASSLHPRAPVPQPSTATLPSEDEHVVVTPLTPPRPDLALGEAAAQEVQLLPVVRGRGAYGRVYEGLYGGVKVAVKVMRDVGDMSAGDAVGSLDHVRSSFAQEVEVLGRCQHPNVVRLMAACVTPPKLLLVMELMETSLEKLVYRKDGVLLPLRTALYIALDVAKGLEYLHPTILHRDLKPGNVLINGPNSPRPIAKITDFGVSRLRSTVLITKHPEAGTPAYMAPETFDVKNYTLTHHVDMYSYGVLLWVLMTGEHPWRGFQMVEVAYKVTINRERLPVTRIPPARCPVRLRALMEQCWEHEPRRRPAAAEVVKEIQGLLDVMPPF